MSSLSQSLRCTKSLRPTLDRKSHTSERQEVREWFGGKIDQLEHIFNVTPTLLVRELWAIEILNCFTPFKREMSNKCKQQCKCFFYCQLREHMCKDTPVNLGLKDLVHSESKRNLTDLKTSRNLRHRMPTRSRRVICESRLIVLALVSL